MNKSYAQKIGRLSQYIHEGVSKDAPLKERKRELIITVEEFTKLEAYRGQFCDGKSMVCLSRVKKLTKEEILDALNFNNAPIVLSHDMRINQGNHRKEAAKLALKKGYLKLTDEIQVTQNLVKQTLNRQSLDNIRANVDTARGNVEEQAVHGNHDMAVKIYKPIFNAIKIACPKYAKQRKRANKLSMKIGAVINNNPYLYEKILANQTFLDITGADLYKAKSLPEAQIYNFFNTTPKVDLRGLEKHLATILHTPLDFIIDLKETSIWKKYYNLNKTLEYPILGLGFRNRLFESSKKFLRNSDKLTTEQVKNALINKRNLILPLLEVDFIRNTVAGEERIIKYFEK